MRDQGSGLEHSFRPSVKILYGPTSVKNVDGSLLKTLDLGHMAK